MLGVKYELHSGEVLDLSALTDKQRAFFERADRLFSQGAPWSDFQNFYLQRQSAIWFNGGDPRSERLPTSQVTRSPLYRAVKDMGLRLGVAQGYLRWGNGKPDPTMTLDQFKDG